MKRLLAGVLATCIGSLAYAETLEEVVVTAQKREQNIRDVPISVATIGGSEFSALFNGGADVRGLSTRVPGLYIESSNGRVAPRFYIRGLGNIDFDLAASQPVSVIMDEVVMENVILKSFPIFDIDRVEVSRGPQGSLFGRNTTAGIVKLVSRKPTMEKSGYIEASAGSLGTANIEAAFGGKIADGAAARLSVLYQNRNDWINNAFTGDEEVMGGFQEGAARLQVLFEPSDNFSALLSMHMRSLDGTASVFRANVFDTGGNALNANYDRDVIVFDEGDNNPQEYDSSGATFQFDYVFNDMTVTSVTSFQQGDGRSLGDIDGGYGAVFLPESGPGFIPFNSQTQDAADVEQFTQEFRLSSDPEMNDGFGWQFGAFFFDSELEIETSPFFVAPSVVVHNNEAWALFGQATMPITDNMDIVGGFRWSDDEKTLTSTVNPIAADFNVDLSDDQISGDVALNWKHSDNGLIYARYARGFKAPTIQGRDIAFFGAPSTATSETSDSFELGFKQRMFGGRADISAAVYAYEVKDIQFSAVGGAGNLIQLVNADAGNGMGFEFEGRWLVTDNFEWTAGFAYNDTEIDDPDLRVGVCGSGLCSPTNPIDGDGFALVDGNPFPNAPRVTFNTTADIFVPLEDGGEFFFFADYAVQGRTNIFLYSAEEFVVNAQNELGIQLGYRKADGSWEAYFFARNVTDEENVQGAIDFNNLTGFFNEPRVAGFTFRSNFN